MNDLPQSGTVPNQNQPTDTHVVGSNPIGKEGESLPSLEHSIQDIQKEIDLPKEVHAAGVKTQPTVVHLPQAVSHMGVQQTGANTQIGNGKTISLPLTQAQISEGLEKDMQYSLKWLAVWCVRKLKQFRMFQMKTKID